MSAAPLLLAIGLFCALERPILGVMLCLLVLFLPSLLYWSSALGKDAWSVMGLGICSYGVARVMTQKRFSGLLILAAGLAAVVLVRPHVALTVGSGLVLECWVYA